MDIKHREVVSWLREVYGEESVPQYEKTERSISLLHQIMSASRQAEAHAEILVEDYTQKSVEYTAEATQIGQWLSTVGVEPSIISEEGRKALSAYTNAYQSLDVVVPNVSNLLLASNQLELEHMQIGDEREREKSIKVNLLEMSQQLSKKLLDMRRISRQAEANWGLQVEEAEGREKQKNFLQIKMKNYSDDCARYEAIFSQSGMTSDITHTSLMKKWEELKALEKEVMEMSNRLSHYTLPADMQLAEVQVEEARQQLKVIMDALIGQHQTSSAF